MRFFHTSHSTGSDDGLWTSIDADSLRLGRDGFTVATIELAYWDDLDSSATPTYGKYNVQAGYVYVPDPRTQLHAYKDNSDRLLSLGRSDAFGALRSCRWELVGDRAELPAFSDNRAFDVFCPHSGDTVVKWASRRTWILCVAECMWRYGAKDVVCDISGNNRHALMKSARCEL